MSERDVTVESIVSDVRGYVMQAFIAGLLLGILVGLIVCAAVWAL